MLSNQQNPLLGNITFLPFAGGGIQILGRRSVGVAFLSYWEPRRKSSARGRSFGGGCI